MHPDLAPIETKALQAADLGRLMSLEEKVQTLASAVRDLLLVIEPVLYERDKTKP